MKQWIGIGPDKVGRNFVGNEVGQVGMEGGGVWAISHPMNSAISCFLWIKQKLMGDNMTARRDIFNKAGDPIVHTIC